MPTLRISVLVLRIFVFTFDDLRVFFVIIDCYLLNISSTWIRQGLQAVRSICLDFCPRHLFSRPTSVKQTSGKYTLFKTRNTNTCTNTNTTSNTIWPRNLFSRPISWTKICSKNSHFDNSWIPNVFYQLSKRETDFVNNKK